MSFTTVSHNFTMKAVAALVVVAMTFDGIMLASMKDANADPDHDQLRPGCEWDPHNWWVQYRQVFPPAMNRDISVQIKAATGGGDASLYMPDGLWGFDKGTSDWIWSGHITQTLANDNVALIAPVAGDDSFYIGWDGLALTTEGLKIRKWETFLTQELSVYLQCEFGINPNRNTIAGPSMGAAATAALTTHHRDQFKWAASLSGYYQTSNPVTVTGTTVVVADAGVISPTSIWGLPVPALPGRKVHDPSMLLDQLQGLPTYVSSVQGVQSLRSDSEVLNRPAPQLPDTVWRAVMELISHASMQRFEQDARAAGLNAQFVYSPNGIRLWELWGRDAALTRPHILGALGL